MAAAAKIASALLVLSVAFTVANIAAAQYSIPSSPPFSSDDETGTPLVKACSDALGPGGATLVEFCAHDLLGHKADSLAGCDKREAVAIVVTEARKKAKVVEEFQRKIKADRTLCKEEKKELHSCWKSLNGAVISAGKVYADIAVKKISLDPMMGEIDEKVAAAMGKCRFSADGKHGSLWPELERKAEVSLKAQAVALAFSAQYYSV